MEASNSTGFCHGGSAFLSSDAKNSRLLTAGVIGTAEHSRGWGGGRGCGSELSCHLAPSPCVQAPVPMGSMDPSTHSLEEQAVLWAWIGGRMGLVSSYQLCLSLKEET